MSQNLPYPTPHIHATPADIAPTVLMPGDPLRAKFIAENYLQERNIPFTAERFRASFDQPFRSLAAAERFFTLYNRSETAAFTPEEIAAKLVDTGNAAFPYVLPNDKQLCLFRFSARDILRV